MEKVLEWLKMNEEEFNELIEELDSWCGYLNDGRYYPMGYLNDFYQNSDAIEVLERAFFGYDEDDWYTDSYGRKNYGAFNPNREYFHFNGYGNLVSSNEVDYTNYLDEYFVSKVIEEYNHLDIPEEFDEIIKEEGLL